MDSKFISTIKNFFTDYDHSEYPYCQDVPGETRTFNPEGSSLDIILLDISGSMAASDYPPSRLEAAQDASMRFLSQLQGSNPNALIGVVCFSMRARIVYRPTRAKDDFIKLRDAINNLSSETSTNITEGLTLSGKVINKCRGISVPRVLMLTDGHDSGGWGDPEQAAQKLKDSGIQLDIIGIGGNPSEVNEPQLKRMASVVGGKLHYWFINSVGGLIRKFEVLALREVK